jgi:hypothetical protein
LPWRRRAIVPTETLQNAEEHLDYVAAVVIGEAIKANRGSFVCNRAQRPREKFGWKRVACQWKTLFRAGSARASQHSTLCPERDSARAHVDTRFCSGRVSTLNPVPGGVSACKSTLNTLPGAGFRARTSTLGSVPVGFRPSTCSGRGSARASKTFGCRRADSRVNVGLQTS